MGSKLLGIAFGLIFVFGGLIFANETVVPTFSEWINMQDWQPTSAEVLVVDGGENFVSAQYRYQVNGSFYTGERVYVTQFKDNIGSYHPSLYARLNRARAKQQSVDIWVNPNNPNEAVIDKGMRWGLFAFMTGFCSIFILIGLAVCYASIRHTAKKDFHKEKQASSEYTSGAWQQRKGWQTPRIRSDAKTGMWGLWVFAIFWNGISVLICLQFFDEIAKQNYMALISLLFPLVGLGILYVAIRKSYEYLRFGIIELLMDPYPGSIGGHVGGTIEIKHLQYDDSAVNSADFNISLECVHSYTSGSGKNRSHREDIKWAEAGQARIRRSAFGIQLAFRFDVPDHLPEANSERGSTYHFWRVTVKAELPGADLNRKYDIPVFNTDSQSSRVRHDISAQVEKKREAESRLKASAIARGNFHLTDLTKSIKISDLNGKIKLYHPMFRNKALAAFAMIFAGGFSFAIFTINSGSSGGLFSIFIFLFSIPFALVGLAASIAVIYLPFNSLSVTIENGTLRSVRRLLFLPLSRYTLPFSDIDSLSIKLSSSTSQGAKKTKYFKVIAHIQAGKKITIAEGIEGEDLANHFKNYLAKKMKIH